MTLPHLPNKKYNIIYADPPWSYKDKAAAGSRGSSFKYPTEENDWIDKFPIDQLASDNCFLFMWATMPKLPEIFETIKMWKFKYRTCAFTWMKKNKKADSLFMGMGNWTRANSELCLLATRGNPKRVSGGVRSAILARREEHSKKPAEARDRIVKLCGDLPRIELFARQTAKGWDCWGNEIQGGFKKG